jgi:hypothetical protein
MTFRQVLVGGKDLDGLGKIADQCLQVGTGGRNPIIGGSGANR